MASIRLSASRIKELETCTWKFYCKNILKLGEDANPKTNVGTVVHLVLEMLVKRPKRTVFVRTDSVGNDKAIAKLINKNFAKFKIPHSFWKETIELIDYAVREEDFLSPDAIKTLPPETEFILNKDGYELKGVIDFTSLYADKVVIRDYKTQAKLFTEEEVEFNIQDLIYQLYIHKEYKLPSYTEFWLVRHKLRQETKPASPELLEGLDLYLKELYAKLQKFDIKSAKSKFAKDDDYKKFICGFAFKRGALKKDGTPMFCCKFKFSFDYWALLDKNGEIIKSSYEDDLLADKEKSETVEKRFYAGCPAFQRY